MQFNCNHCPKQYAKKQNLSDHMWQAHGTDVRKKRLPNYECGLCQETFTQSSSVFRHIRGIHVFSAPTKCLYCTSVFGNQDMLKQHIAVKHNPIRQLHTLEDTCKLQSQKEQHATKKCFQSYRLNIIQQLDLLALMDSLKKEIQSFLINKIIESGPLKIQFSVFASLMKPIDETKVSCHASSHSKVALISLNDDDFFQMVDEMVRTLQISCSSGSGFIIESLQHVDINISI